MSTARTSSGFRLICLLSVLSLPLAMAQAEQPIPPAPPPSVAPQPPRFPDAPIPPQPPRTNENQVETPTVVHVYDVRDLLADVPDFTDSPDLSTIHPSPRSGGQGGGGGGSALFGGPGPRPSVQEQRTEQLVKLIQQTVAADTWRESGGMVGAIRETGGRLIVNNTPAAHEQLRTLLAELRKTAAVTVRVRAHWVLVERDDLEKALKPAATADGKAAPATTRPALLATTAQELSHLPGVLAHIHGELTCLDGQHVWMYAADTRSYVADVTIAADGGSQIDPTIAELAKGLVLNLACTLSEDKQTALVTLMSQAVGADVQPSKVTLTAEPSTRPSGATRPAASGPLNAALESSSVRMHELHTTIRVPLGQTILVGGLTVDPGDALNPNAKRDANNGDGNPKAPAKAPQLYLLIEVTSG